MYTLPHPPHHSRPYRGHCRVAAKRASTSAPIVYSACVSVSVCITMTFEFYLYIAVNSLDFSFIVSPPFVTCPAFIYFSPLHVAQGQLLFCQCHIAHMTTTFSNLNSMIQCPRIPPCFHINSCIQYKITNFFSLRTNPLVDTFCAPHLSVSNSVVNYVNVSCKLPCTSLFRTPVFFCT